MTEPVALVAHDLTPSQTASLDRTKIKGDLHRCGRADEPHGDHRQLDGDSGDGGVGEHHAAR